ncbi:hypothetical protein GQ53DRAFT_821058 [Thozetella sp. PMI_491]|nr:hypothetical protein GQ53DRAFT_821058 [Thozetella sp. PMI_491]
MVQEYMACLAWTRLLHEARGVEPDLRRMVAHASIIDWVTERRRDWAPSLIEEKDISTALNLSPATYHCGVAAYDGADSDDSSDTDSDTSSETDKSDFDNVAEEDWREFMITESVVIDGSEKKHASLHSNDPGPETTATQGTCLYSETIYLVEPAVSSYSTNVRQIMVETL